MERQLINYLPFILRDLPAFKAAMASQQPEFSALWDSVAAFQDDLFILTAGDRGLARWEYILDLVPKASDSFDVRRIRILTALNRQLPYTLPQLQNVLNNIYGVGSSAAEVPENSYTLWVTMPYTDTYADTMELVDAMSPQNLFLQYIAYLEDAHLTAYAAAAPCSAVTTCTVRIPGVIGPKEVTGRAYAVSAASSTRVQATEASDSDLAEAVTLSGETHEVDILGIDTVENDGKPARRVSIQITSGQTAYICHQVGVYGKLDTGPDETLLMVVQDDRGVEIPAASTSSDFKIELAVLLAVSNNANISVTVSPQVQAIMQLVAKELDKHDKDPDAHASVIEAAASAAVKRVEESGQIMTEAQVKKLIQTHSGSGYFGEYSLVLRADGWTPLPDTGPYQYIYDAELADSDSSLIPSGGADVNDFAVTARAGVLNACETRDGSVRFFSQRVPDADIHVTLTLNGSGKGGGTNASGNVTIGQGLKRDESGAIAVSIGDGLAFDATDALTVRKDTVVTSDDLVNDEKLSQEIAEILK